MGNETELTMRFKVNDDGSVVLDKIGKNIQGIENQTTRMNTSLKLIKWDAMFNLGERAFHTAGRIYGMAKAVAESTNEIERNAKIAGLTTDTYQKMAYAAKMTDVDMDSLGKGMKILAGHMDDVRKGSEQAVSLFQSIGVATIDASGKTKSFDGILEDLADRFKSMPDGIDKVALSTDLFGRAGERLIPYLNQGKEGLRGFYAEIEKMGGILDEKILSKGAELEDRFKRAGAFWDSVWKRIVIGAYEATDAIQKFQVASMMREEPISKLLGIPTGKEIRQAVGIEKKPPTPSMMAVIGEEVEKGPPAYLRQSEAALKAIKEANEKIIDQNIKLSDLYDYESNVLKGQARFLESREKAMALIEKLGLKTGIGAKKDIEDVIEQYRLLGTLGLKPEEMLQGRTKLVEQLKAIEEKYKAPSGWKEMAGEEGGVRWWSNIVPKEGIGAEISEMVTEAINELNRMQTAAEAAMGPKTIMIDSTPVQNASQAVEELRKRLDDLSSRDFPITVTINQRGASGENIEMIEDTIARRITNKSSRLGSIIRKEIDGRIYYGNE